MAVRATRGVFWVAAGNWSTQLAAFLVFAVLSRLLDPHDFGIVALAAVFVGLTQVIANQGFLDALIQRKELERAHVDTAFTISVGFGITVAVLLSLAAAPLAAVFDAQELTPVLIALSMGIPIASTALVPRALLARDLAFRSLSLRTIVATIVGSAVGIGAALLGFGVWSLVAQNLSNQVAGTCVLWSVLDRRPRFGFSRPHFRDLFGFGIHVVGFQILNFFNRRIDDLLIGAFLGPVALGLYVVAYRVLVLLIEVTSSLLDSVSFPLFSRLQEDRERLRGAYYKTSSFAALAAFPVFVGIAASAPQIVDVFFGSKWHGAAPVMRLLSLFGLVQALLYLNSTMLKALGKPSWRLAIVALTLALDAATFVLVVSYGIIAVAAALVVVGYAVAPVWFLAVNALLRIDVAKYVAHIRAPALGAVVMAGVMLVMVRAVSGVPGFVGLAATWTVGAVAYGVAAWLLSPTLLREAAGLVVRALPVRPGAGRLAPAAHGPASR